MTDGRVPGAAACARLTRGFVRRREAADNVGPISARNLLLAVTRLTTRDTLLTAQVRARAPAAVSQGA
jgi:hypothetical protein